MDFLIHWPPGPVVATVQCQGLPCVWETLKVHRLPTKVCLMTSNKNLPTEASHLWLGYVKDLIKNNQTLTFRGHSSGVT